MISSQSRFSQGSWLLQTWKELQLIEQSWLLPSNQLYWEITHPHKTAHPQHTAWGLAGNRSHNHHQDTDHSICQKVPWKVDLCGQSLPFLLRQPLMCFRPVGGLPFLEFPTAVYSLVCLRVMTLVLLSWDLCCWRGCGGQLTLRLGVRRSASPCVERTRCCARVHLVCI